MTRATITKDNVSPLLAILIWYFLVVSLLTVLVRLATKRYIVHRIDLDDYFLFISVFFAAAQSITILLATSNGLGQRLNSLDANQLSALLKASQYAATFLLTTSVCFAKLSLVAFLRSLTPLALDRQYSLIVGSVVVLWATTATVSMAFQCPISKPWDYDSQSCFNRTSWADYVAAMNILTDVCLIGLPLLIVARLQAAWSKKAILMLLFMARMCVIAAVICQIVYHNRIKPSSDLTFDIWPVTVCTQLIQCLSVLTTCFVYLRPFLGSLETGFIKIRDPSLRGIPGFRTEDIELQDNAAFHDPQNLSTTTTVTAEHRDWDTHSHSRILRTTTFAVEKRDYKKPLHSSPSIQFVNDHDGSSSKMPTEHTCHNEYS